MEQKLMQFGRPLQMRGKGLQKVPFPRLNPNRIQRSWQAQLQYSSRRAQEADGNYVTPSLRASPFVVKFRGVITLALGEVRLSLDFTWCYSPCRRNKRAYFVIVLQIGIGIKWIDVPPRPYLCCPVGPMSHKPAAD